MTEPLQVGQFAIVDGEPVDRGPNAGVFHGKGPADDRAELFLLAEGTTPAGEAFAGHVITDLGHRFAALDMSLTGSLGRIFAEAERNVRDWNRKSIAQHRVSIGLTAFGRRGEQAVIAQAGPTIAFHLHEGEMTIYSPEADHARPIGVAPVQPELTRIPFDEGDRLLLLSSAALGELDDELIAGILALAEDQILPDLYRRVQQLRQVTVILVTGPHPPPVDDLEEAPSEEEYVIGAAAESGEGHAPGTFQPSLFIEHEAEAVVWSARAQLMDVTPRRAMGGPAPMMTMEAPAPLLRAVGASAISINRLAAEGAARAARSRAAVTTVTAEATRPEPPRPVWRAPGGGYVAHSAPNMVANERPHSPGARPRKDQSFSRGLVPPGSAPPRPELLTEDLPLVAELAAGQRARSVLKNPVSETLAAENGASMAGGAPLVRPRSNMGGRWKGNNTFRHRPSIGGQLPPAWMVILGAFIVLVLLAGIVTVPRMLNGGDDQRMATLLTGAQQRIAASTNQTDLTQKREMLTEAQAMLLAVRDNGGTAQTDQLISQVAGAISQMDNIRQPQAVEAIASLEQFGTKPVAVARMAVGTDAAYLLDVNASQVVVVPFAGEPKAVFAENKDEKRGKPVALAYFDRAELGGPTLLIADSSNKIWAYSASAGLRAIAFAGPNNLAISDIAVHGPDLFVLDSAQGTVYRFLPTPEGFPNAPVVALKNTDLSAARRLMADGEFITSDANGTVHRFIAGGQTAITFSQAGIDRRLVAPETAQPLANKGEVALLDASNDRIVILRRDGGFDRQYRHPDFGGASAFAVRNGEAFIFSGSQLRRVVL